MRGSFGWCEWSKTLKHARKHQWKVTICVGPFFCGGGVENIISCPQTSMGGHHTPCIDPLGVFEC